MAMSQAEVAERGQIVKDLENQGKRNVYMDDAAVTKIYNQRHANPAANPSPSATPTKNPPVNAGNNTLTENDVDYNSSAKIPKLKSGFTKDEVDAFDKRYTADKKSFHYQDANGNPSDVPVRITTMGGKPVYRVEKDGNPYYARAIPNNRFMIDLKDANGPLNETGWSSEHGGTEVSPGSKDYQNWENTLKNSLDPVTRHAIQYDPKSPGSIVSNYLGLDQVQKSEQHQEEAANVTKNWNDANQRDGLYKDAEAIMRDLGPAKIKSLTDHAAATKYVMGQNPDADTQKFYQLLNLQAQINARGGFIGSGVQNASGLSLTGKALPQGYLSFGIPKVGTAGFNIGVQDALDAMKTGTLNATDAFANIETNRLLDRKKSIQDFKTAVSLPGGLVPVDDDTRAEVRKALHDEIEQGGHKLSDDPAQYGPKNFLDTLGKKDTTGKQGTDQGGDQGGDQNGDKAQPNRTPAPKEITAKDMAKPASITASIAAENAREQAEGQQKKEEKGAEAKASPTPNLDAIGFEPAGQVTGKPDTWDWNKPAPTPPKAPIAYTGTSGAPTSDWNEQFVSNQPTGRVTGEPSSDWNQAPPSPMRPVFPGGQKYVPPVEEQKEAPKAQETPKAEEEPKPVFPTPSKPTPESTSAQFQKKVEEARHYPEPTWIDQLREGVGGFFNKEFMAPIKPKDQEQPVFPTNQNQPSSQDVYERSGLISENQLPSDTEVGAPLGAPNDAPGVARLHYQEHVDSLQPGTPFYWKDHPHAYVRV